MCCVFFPPRYGDQYEWNKVITCIHNVFTTHRHLEHYGDVVIKMKNSDACTCKISFLKVSAQPPTFGYSNGTFY